MELRELEQSISDLETQLDRLRALYEQYFVGIEKLEPIIPRKNVDRTFHALRSVRMNNTAQRFRFQQLVQRYNTMQTYWRRVCRQIEEGTYTRDVIRAKARTKKYEGRDQQIEEQQEIPTHEVNLDELEDTNPGHSDAAMSDESPTIPVDVPPSRRAPHVNSSMYDLLDEPMFGAERARHPLPDQGRNAPAPPPPPRQPEPRRPPPPPALSKTGSSGELSGDRIQSIYRDYVSARQRCNQSTLGLTLEKVTSQIKHQEETLRKKHGKDVDFQVTVKDGKAILKAVRRE